jgi:hypothetical protein
LADCCSNGVRGGNVVQRRGCTMLYLRKAGTLYESGDAGVGQGTFDF